MKKNNKGITLIALVITIIILIILAGVSLNIVLGEKGLINKARESKERATIGSIQEKLDLIKGISYIDGEGINTLSRYLYFLDKEKIKPYTVTEITPSETSAIIEVNEKYNFLIECDTDGNFEIKYKDENLGNTPKDTIKPEEATIEISGQTTVTTLPATLSAKVTHIDNESGVNIEECRYILNESSDNLEDVNSYTEEFISNEETITLSLEKATDYYLHVLTVDNEGNAIETIKGPISVVATYHKHAGSSTSKGGCYTIEKANKTLCGKTLYISSATPNSSGKVTYGVSCATHGYLTSCNESGGGAFDKGDVDDGKIKCEIVTKTTYTYDLGCKKTENVTIDGYAVTY